MEKHRDTNKYFAYVRKSTEGEERQALSISSQVDKVHELFGTVHIVEILEEKHSAFKPYNRPVFEEMMNRIQKGEANGIIAWHPDRLSRNEIDASTVTYLVRTGVIKDLKFGSYNFDNSPEGIMMLQLALSQSQYFSSKLGKDVKRGLEKKFEMGWQPNMCPNGYMNVRENGFSTIEVDKTRFKTVRKAFDLMLTGNCSVPEVLDKLNNEWDFLSKTKRKTNDGKLARSSLYRMFTNIFYAGIIEYNGKQKLGKHKAMISLEEYDRIQVLLGRKGKPRKRVHNFAYSGVIRCADCDCLVCADRKVKTIKKTGKQKEYIYYRCTHKKPSYDCKQPAVEVKTLEQQIDAFLSRYEFHPDFKKLFFEIIEYEKKNTPDETKQVTQNLVKKIDQLRLEKVNLTKMSCRGLLPDNEFLEQRNTYEKEIIHLTQKVERLQSKRQNTEDVLDDISFAIQARANFQKSDESDKKNVLLRLGSNQKLKDRILLIQPKKWLIEVENKIKPIEGKYLTLELNKLPLTKAKSERLDSLRCELR